MAGEVFAELGYDAATSKLICERAGMNAASVNYHFGGVDELYLAALKLAHRRIISHDEVDDVASSTLSAKDKLREYVTQMAVRLLDPTARSWELRLLAREIVAPTKSLAEFVRSDVMPQRRQVQNVVAEILGIADPDDETVRTTMLSVMSPIVMLAIAGRSSAELFLPRPNSPADVQVRAKQIADFSIAGVDAAILKVRR